MEKENDMMLHVAISGERNVLLFKKLNVSDLDRATKLCDRCVGKNLYSKANLASIIDNPIHYFYLLETPQRVAVGYIYFFLTDLDEMATLSKLPRERLSVISQKNNPVIGNLQSIGVVEEYRHLKLAAELVRFFLKHLKTHSTVDTVFGVLWKIDGYVPMEKTLKEFDFRYLTDAHMVWYDNQDLICPYCKGRCKCNAAIYYKSIEGRY